MRGYRRLIDPAHGEIIMLLLQNGTYLQVPGGECSRADAAEQGADGEEAATGEESAAIEEAGDTDVRGGG